MVVVVQVIYRTYSEMYTNGRQEGICFIILPKFAYMQLEVGFTN
jgi:hypothetical protein